MHNADWERFGGNCCAAKQYYLHENNLVETLEISPRVVICKKSLSTKHSFEKLLIITNKGLYARRLFYYTDSPEDTYLKIYNDMIQTYIEPNFTMHMKVVITPRERNGMNRRRLIFIEAEHPNIKFEIPIIVTVGKSKACMPKAILFPRSIPYNLAFYEFLIYNPSAEEKPVIIKTLCSVLEVCMSSNVMPKRGYVRVLLALKVDNLKCFQDMIKVKVENLPYQTIDCEHKPIASMLYVNLSHLNFEELKYNHETRKDFIICNESELMLTYSVKFLTESIGKEDPNTTVAVSEGKEMETDEEVELVYPTEFALSSFFSETEEFLHETVLAPKMVDLKGYKHFGVNTQGGQIKPNSYNSITVIFRPVVDGDPFPETEEPPFLIQAKMLCTVMDELNNEQRMIVLTGLIKGPEIELTPTTMDLRVYLGEEYCENITALNIDGRTDAYVYFKHYSNQTAASITMTPAEGHTVASCKRGVFRMSLYTKAIGKFLIRMQFKVRNGATYNILVKGTSLQVRLKCFPDIVELGSVPVALAQKRYVLLMNPLNVPVTVQCTVPDDGDEVPLLFNVRFVDEIPPLTYKDPIKSLEEEDSECKEKPVIPKIVSEVDARNSQATFRSLSEDSVISSRFDEEVMEPLNNLANLLVSTIKRRRIIEKHEMEARTIYETIHCLMTTDYFKDITANKNYAYIDWNALPNDPKEIYCDSEVIYLSPNTGKNLMIYIIPNRLGYYNRALELRVCPIIEDEECWGENDKTLVSSELMVSKLWIEYDCRIPEIVWTDEIKFDDRAIYVGQETDFEFEFDNKSNVGGFIYFDVVPDSEYGVMTFKEDIWKFFLSPDINIYIVCTVTFKKIGKVVLPGIVKLVGNTVGMPFHLRANVLPTEVRVTPKIIYHKQKVLERTKVHFYIDNITPTVTWLSIRLKHDRHQYLDTYGAILAPTGQGICVTIYTKINDPELYKNVLYVDLHFGKVWEVPISFNIEGMPIFFDPDINDEFNVGVILTNTEQNYYDDIPNYSRVIRVWNCGERAYRLNIRKLKSSQGPPKCTVSEVKARLQVTPKAFLLEPGSENYIVVTANGCEETTVYNEFRILVTSLFNRQCFMSIRLVVRAQFVQPQLNWSRKEICMNYYRTHRLKEHFQLELVHLTNVASVAIESVNLKVLGPFKIKELFEHKFCKELNFAIAGLEKKQFTIVLNKDAINNKFCMSIAEGRIICMANGKVQRSLPLKLIIYKPELKIAQPNITLFRKYNETDVTIEIKNTGCLDAHYKWVKLNEDTQYISEDENSRDFAHELLSDIMRMLDLEVDESDAESLYQRNMSLRYQKYRCRLQKLEDPIGVSVILDQIIEDLDLEHKRFIMHLDELTLPNASLDNSSQYSSKSYVEKTIDHIIGRLVLEDSYDVPPASSECCVPERAVYFREKSGTLPAQQKAQCLLHLPGVRKGYATTAAFQLQVVGGVTQAFNVTLVNLERTVLLSNNNIYLGVRPWYELFKANARILSVTQYAVDVRLEQPNTTKPRERIATGYIKIRNEKRFDIPEFGDHLVRMEGIMGFSDEFRRDVRVVVNDSDELYIHVRGQGIMPILTVTSKLDRTEQDVKDIEQQYKFLQRIYYFEMFRIITDDDAELGVDEENDRESILSESYSTSLLETTSSSASSTREQRFFKFMQSYVQVNNNGELPDALLLEQLIETEQFMEHVKCNADTRALLHLVYQDYVKLTKCYDEKMPINLKHFTAQPLPCELHSYVLKMDGLKLDVIRKFEINLQFFGPGKLIAAARTVVRIPGLVVVFNISESVEENKQQEFLFYTAEDKKPDMFDKRYRNLYERSIDEETDPKLKHAHSFDIDAAVKHRRDVTTKNRKNIQNYYNSLNKSVYMEHKHHFILSKIVTNSKRNFTGTNLRVVVFFKPESKYYEDDQLLEDYLYIDNMACWELALVLERDPNNDNFIEFKQNASLFLSFM